MKKIFTRIATSATALLLAAGTSLVIFNGTASAIPWSSNATGLDHPGFNVFTGVPGFGDESDFVRGHVSGSTTDFTDPVNDTCVDGQQYSVRVYVHNGANQTLNNNGTGPGVAHNTKVKVSLPATTASNITGTISASNASSVSDTLTIHCSNGKTMTMSYVTGSAIEQRMDGTTSPLSDSIVSNGAPVGSHSVNGDVWGCFEQRVLVFLKVQVKEVPSPPQLTAVCNLFTIGANEDRKVTVNQYKTTTVNAAFKSLVINWGDNSNSTTVNDSSQVVGTMHQYNADGTYQITTVTHFTANGKDVISTSPSCNQQVTFAPNTPPSVTPPTTPTTLVNTGAGSIAGVFAAATAFGAIVYRRLLSRRLG